ncbi:MAG: DUF2953 domain-containing protein [Clostridia bacterium]|nr:DUF2953 domain-containing protein [Clostridia bacterium]
MKVLSIIGIVIGSLILLLTVALLSPVTLSVKTDKKGRVKVKIRILFLPFTLYPGKEKKKKIKNKKAEKKPSANEKKPGRFQKAESIIETVKEFSSVVGFVIDRMKKILGGLVITSLKADIVIADSSDAANSALTYGAVCAVIYPLVEWLKDKIKFGKNADKINVVCDFTKEKSSVSLDFKIRGMLFKILYPLLSVLWRYLNNSKENEDEIKK